MILVFVVSLFVTLMVTRVFAHLFHDRKNYGTPREKSKTITAFVRKRTGVDVHHFHFGIFILMVVLSLIYFNGLNTFLVIMLGISLSWILDQLMPVCNRSFNYFDKRRVFESVFLHITISIIAVAIS